MRILLALSGWTLAKKLETCRGIRHVQAHYFARHLREAGHDVAFCKVGPGTLTEQESVRYYAELDVPDADHCLCLEPRAFHRRTFRGAERNVSRESVPVWRTTGKCYLLDALRSRVHGCIATICDMPRALGGEDVTFYAVRHPPDYPLVDGVVWLGWAADSQTLYPEQPDDGKFHVLLDHGHYNRKADDSNMLLKTLDPIADMVLVKRFAPGGVEDVPVPGWRPVDQRQPGATHVEAAAVHRWAHIFCVTHQESLGLSVLEAAMAGNLVVARKGFIKPSLLAPLKHVLYDTEPDWRHVFNTVNTRASREAAEPFDRWRDMASIATETFQNWELTR